MINLTSRILEISRKYLYSPLTESKIHYFVLVGL